MFNGFTYYIRREAHLGDVRFDWERGNHPC